MRCIAVIMFGIGSIATIAAAQQATTAAGASRAYGSRVGVRNESPDLPGMSLDIRTTQRLRTRIDSRLNSRIERRAAPSDTLWAYRIPQDDGSRRGGGAYVSAPATGTGAVSRGN